MKKYFSVIKEFLKNKKYRSLIWLIFYFIFFFIVISMIGTSNNYQGNYEKEEITSLDKYKNNEVYISTITITYNSDVIILEHNKSDIDEYDVLTDINNRYNNSKIIDENGLVLIELNDFNNAQIYDYINKSIFDYETKYSDGRVLKSYKLLLKDFNVNENINVSNDDYLIINTIEENNIISSVELDLTKYILSINEKISLFKIKIDYR